MFPFSNLRPFGLDIGSATLKAVELERKNGTITAPRAAIASMPGGAFSGGVLLDPPAAAEAIRKLCREHRFRGKHVITGVSGSDVFVARVKLERGAPETLAARIRERACDAAPFSLEQAYLDYQLIDNFSDSQWVDVLVAAVKPGRLDVLQDVLRRAGKRATIVDVVSCALANVFEVNYAPAPSAVSGLLHVGASTLTVCIVRGSTPLIAEEVSLTTVAGETAELNRAERVAIELERIFEQMDEIADEHPLEPGSGQIERLFLSGGGARSRGLPEVLKERIGLPFEELNPFRKIELSGSDTLSRLVWDHAHCMPVAVGLALRGLDERG
ncbi:MAG TPA: pilus assembly protein PilM [Bryobacterales bacterium]|nr:pilus assembly protein PilM [Bryobacterales bacterium]